MSCLRTFWVLNIPRYFYFASQQCWRGYCNKAVGVWFGEWVRASVVFCLVSTKKITVFAQSLSNSTCKLLMMRGGTLLILGYCVNSGTQCIKSCGHHTNYSFSPISFKCGWWEVEPYWFCSARSRSTFEFCLKPCGCDTGYSFSLINLKLNM